MGLRPNPCLDGIVSKIFGKLLYDLFHNGLTTCSNQFEVKIQYRYVYICLSISLNYRSLIVMHIFVFYGITMCYSTGY